MNKVQEKRSDIGMDELFSALLDDELDGMARERVFSRLASESALRDAWSRQHLLRALLAGEARCLPDAGFASRVMAAIQSDAGTDAAKVLPLRRPARPRYWAVGGLAAAASVMAVMLVLRVMPLQNPAQTATLAAAAPVPAAESAPAVRVASDAAFQREMEEYLLEHQRLAARHGLSAPRGYMRVVTPGFTHVSYSGE